MEINMEKKKKFFKKGGGGGGSSSKESSICNGGGVGNNMIINKPQSQCSTRSCTPLSTNSGVSTITALSDNVFTMNNVGGGGGNVVPNNSNSNNNNIRNTSRPRRPTTTTSTTSNNSSSHNSSSLDEAENRMTHDRRFVTAPRRARSAERFDGIRVALSNTSGLERDELLSRSIQSTRNNGGFYIPRSSDSLASIPKAMPSPPPPYTATVLDKNSCPPSYKQAVAMTQAAILAKEAAAKKFINNDQHRYTTMNHHHGAQSFEAANYTTHGMQRTHGGGTLRSATSVPTFKNYNNTPACSCSKCQIQERLNSSSTDIGCGDCNDAVYMESQAFLMHEIMTDGMAFCSIM